MTIIEKGLLSLAVGALVGVVAVGLSSCNSATNAAQATTTTIVSPVVKNETATIAGLSVTPTAQVAVEVTKKTVRKLALPPSRVIVLDGEIGYNALAAAATLTAMSNVSNDPIYIVLQSPGGSVLTGAQLISAMQASKAPVYTICKTMCASMAFMILEYGKKRMATDRTLLMAHPASAGAQGQVDNMASFITTLKRYTNKMEAEVAARMGITFDQYKQKTSAEYWVDSEDGLKDNTIDEIVNIDLEVVNTTAQSQGDNQVSHTPLAFDIKWITK